MANNRQIATQAGKKWLGKYAKYFVKQMGAEAGFKQGLTSSAGAQGPAQIMPATAKAWGVKNVNDPNEAYNAAAKNMAGYVKKFGSFRDALVAYNAGPGRVGGKLPGETSAYIKKIMGNGGEPANAMLDTSTSDTEIGTQPSTPSLQSVLTNYNTAVDEITKPVDDNELTDPNVSLQSTVKLLDKSTDNIKTGEDIAPSGTMDGDVRTLFERAVQIDKKGAPYSWGGGHGSKPTLDGPWDCSGAVSAVLGVNPRVASQFKAWGQGGKGKNVTIYAKDDHVLMEINGHFFGTSKANKGGGAGWIPSKAVSKSYLKNFTVRHPKGM